MPGSRIFDYGTCPCGGTYESRLVVIRIPGLPELKDVPQGVCPKCGGRVYKAQILEQIEGIMRGTKVPVTEFQLPRTEMKNLDPSHSV